MAVDRTALRSAYRPDENQIVAQRLAEAALTATQAKDSGASPLAVQGVARTSRPGIDAFMAAYDLGSDEGIALMCLAEALLRIPDAETADD
jgi:RHH-type proline utilization regulon transcriptional repressor/proline dehydrogenase/delta 1-pyrroline-5-carboxylate dehydrogenase